MGKQGALEVSDRVPEWQHGPLETIPDNPRHFQYADGTPYFLMAYELDWLFALDAENPDDIPRTRQIIGQVKENGFNHIVMYAILHTRAVSYFRLNCLTFCGTK